MKFKQLIYPIISLISNRVLQYENLVNDILYNDDTKNDFILKEFFLRYDVDINNPALLKERLLSDHYNYELPIPVRFYNKDNTNDFFCLLVTLSDNKLYGLLIVSDNNVENINNYVFEEFAFSLFILAVWLKVNTGYLTITNEIDTIGIEYGYIPTDKTIPHDLKTVH